MSFYARFAYVNRKDYEKLVVEGFLERQYIPNCCDMGYISDTTDTDKKDYPERNPENDNHISVCRLVDGKDTIELMRAPELKPEYLEEGK